MLWNNNSLQYAGVSDTLSLLMGQLLTFDPNQYKEKDGTVLGEPGNVDLTDQITKLGWKPPAIKSRWDLLPIVTMAENDSPHIIQLSKDDFPDVFIGHPDAQHNLAFRKMGLRWGCSPVLSRLGFDIGGVQYTAVPFMGYFADMEIGMRNLADKTSYNVLPRVIGALNLLPRGETLDELPPYEQLAKLQTAQTELTRAVYWSYTQAGVRIIDTLSASNMYCEFDDLHLAEKGFRLPADPYWLAPPQGSIVPLWHRGGAPNYQPRVSNLLQISSAQSSEG
jgi:nitric oxide synthase oxygenase domain/subunit